MDRGLASLAKSAIFALLIGSAAALAQEPAAPAEGEAAPAESETAPAEGEAVPAEGSAPVEGIAPVEGEAAAPAEAAEVDPAMVSAEEHGSAIDEFFNGSSKENIKERTAEFYAVDAVLEDPFGKFEGREAIAQHLAALYDGIESITFEIKSEFVSGDETVALWTMTLAHGKLNGGEPITVDGVSHVRFAVGKAVAQRDYYDLGALLYENTTIVGRIVRWVKSKAAGL